MGLSSSKFSFDDLDSKEVINRLVILRSHVNILIVGDKSSGKTALSKRLTDITRLGKAWIHIFDTDTINTEEIKTKANDVYDNGIDTSGLSILSTKMFVHGIIWVMDATKMETLADFDHVREACSHLRTFSNCATSIFFSHTDIASRTNLRYIRGLYLEDSSIPNSGECAPERIFYAPLNSGENRDVNYTLLKMVDPMMMWALFRTSISDQIKSF